MESIAGIALIALSVYGKYALVKYGNLSRWPLLPATGVWLCTTVTVIAGVFLTSGG